MPGCQGILRDLTGKRLIFLGLIFVRLSSGRPGVVFIRRRKQNAGNLAVFVAGNCGGSGCRTSQGGMDVPFFCAKGHDVLKINELFHRRTLF